MHSDPMEMGQIPERLAASVLDSLVDVVVVIDDSGVIVWANQAWRDSAALSGAAPDFIRGVGINYLDATRRGPDGQVIGALTGHSVAPSAVVVEGIKDVLAGRSATFESEHPSASLTHPQWFLITATALRDGSQSAAAVGDGPVSGKVVISIRDITAQRLDEERRAILEVELNRAARRRSLGRLAGGVAHNINNMLAVILGHTDLALNTTAPADPLRDELAQIREATERTARLIRQLLTVAGAQRIDPRPLNLGSTIAALLPGLQRLVGERIVLSLQTSAHTWQVDMDPMQIELIVTNLCANARDAIEDRGTIEIEIANEIIDGAGRASYTGAVTGDYVRLTVRDDGHGIPPDILADIFDPFFTTKETAPGIGLGLASVHGAVTQCGGGVTVSSDGHNGTTIEVFLPRHHDAGADDADAVAEASDAPGAQTTETILIVDDEPALLRAAARALTFERYYVITAASAEEAIRVAAEHAGPIHLLVTDVLLPQMGGRDLSDVIAAARPGIPHLFMSGYPSDILTGADGVHPEDHFIAKPFRIDDFASKVREILDSNR